MSISWALKLTRVMLRFRIKLVQRLGLLRSKSLCGPVSLQTCASGVGIHSGQIEGRLVGILSQAGWCLRNRTPSGSFSGWLHATN